MEFNKLTLSKLVIDHVMQSFNFSGEKKRRLEVSVLGVPQSQCSQTCLPPAKATHPRGTAAGLPKSERMSSGGMSGQRSTTVGFWVSLCTYPNLDFPIWPEGKQPLPCGRTLVEGRNGYEFAWWIIKHYANAILSSCYHSCSAIGKVLIPADT